MPENYKETSVAGQSWIRACQVHISNPYGDTPALAFTEETIFIVGETIIKKPGSCLIVEMDVNNPTHLAIYDQLNALYVIAREERDARVAAELAAAQVPTIPPVEP